MIVPNRHVNAVVVGAGAGGGVVAKVLAEAGLSVVLIERGRWQTWADHTDDELISQRTTVLGNAYGPDDERHRRVIENADGSTRIVLPSEGGYNNNAACVGSGTLSYGAMAWRFMTNRLGWHPFPIPMLRNSVPYGGRPKCIHMRTCVGFACPIEAKAGTQNTVIPAAIATGNCEVRTDAVVAEVKVDDRGRARGVVYFDARDRRQEQTADLVIVSASATETARLLLNSKSTLFPNGAGNNNDWVGRNLQGHAYCGARGIAAEEIYEEAGPGATVAFCDFSHGNPGLRGGAMLANEFIPMPYLYTRVRPPGSPRWGRAHKEFQRRNYRRTLCVMGPVQEMPVFDARVKVDPAVRDHWGIPVVRMSGKRHPHDVEIARFISEKAATLLREAGATDVWASVPGLGLSGGQHQAGTCRMGNDPKTSVTNRFGQVHEIDNLFVADGSLNVTNGGLNPALTIMALGYWVGENIAKEWKGGARFKS